MVRKQGGVAKALPPATTFDEDVYTSYIIHCHCLPTIAQRASRGTGRRVQKDERRLRVVCTNKQV